MNDAAGAVSPSSASARTLIIHTSTGQIGGAETSLLAAIASGKNRPVFLVPGTGPLTAALEARGWPYRVLPWPRGLSALTQRQWLRLPFVLPGLVPYLWRLHRIFRTGDEVLSSGFKSHCACLLLAPLQGRKLRFDVRDFLKPQAFRRWIAGAAKGFGCKVFCNSAAVARDYPGAEVRYPQVTLHRPAEDKRNEEGKIIITHLAYFAPYKGQDLFLVYARKILDAGVNAEFWMAGDVIYPAEAYARYSERVYEQAGRLRLTSHVRFLGKVEGADAVQTLLEQSHLLLHCTREPEPFGRAVMEALLCGCEAVCHGGSGVCEVTEVSRDFSGWMAPLEKILGPEFVRVSLRK